MTFIFGLTDAQLFSECGNRIQYFLKKPQVVDYQACQKQEEYGLKPLFIRKSFIGNAEEEDYGIRPIGGVEHGVITVIHVENKIE